MSSTEQVSLSGTKRKHDNSTCLEVSPQNHKFNFLVKLRGFSDLPHELGTYVRTSVYEVNGRLWGLVIYPGGSKTDDTNFTHTSVFLYCISEKDTQAAFSITVLSPHNSEQDYTDKEDTPLSLFADTPTEPKYTTFGWFDFRPRAVILSDYCENDVVTFKVSVNVVETPRMSVLNDSMTSNEDKRRRSEGGVGGMSTSPSHLYSNSIYAPKLFLDPTFSDLTFRMLSSPSDSDISPDIGYEELPAHRVIVCAASEVFKKMLTVDMRESQTNTITIHNFSAIIVKEMLRFLYTGCCDANVLQTEAETLLCVAKQYDIASMVGYLEDYYADSVSVQNIVCVWQLSQTYECAALERELLKFVREHKQEVLKKKSFRSALSLGSAQKIINVLCDIDVESDEEYERESVLDKEVKAGVKVLEGVMIHQETVETSHDLQDDESDVEDVIVHLDEEDV
ncbi:BTB/POZ domain-containing protein [archaeon]|nr:MAG: BTB/POZ domain-containing protein [archaeon]